jgi:hypothetical protein
MLTAGLWSSRLLVKTAVYKVAECRQNQLISSSCKRAAVSFSSSMSKLRFSFLVTRARGVCDGCHFEVKSNELAWSPDLVVPKSGEAPVVRIATRVSAVFLPRQSAH